MEFTAYSVTYTKVINVAGGGLGNGNAYANIEIEYKDATMEEVKGVYYAEYGKNPCRELIGVDIDWGEDDTFNVLDKDGNVVNSSGQQLTSDTEDDDEDDEDKDKDKEVYRRKNVSGTSVSR